ncbi:hypothetical protein SORBI_3003G312000 [Sorghum bicolor]|uniref:Uncharacterized protein n=1 Tax=Sorghum bicolor TaxID=4558 RepID=A0A1W0VZV0_SORBI|nr:hypothetical protein SORBI_3003G312000 [Sorghum bicolor]
MKKKIEASTAAVFTDSRRRHLGPLPPMLPPRPTPLRPPPISVGLPLPHPAAATPRCSVHRRSSTLRAIPSAPDLAKPELDGASMRSSWPMALFHELNGASSFMGLLVAQAYTPPTAMGSGPGCGAASLTSVISASLQEGRPSSGAGAGARDSTMGAASRPSPKMSLFHEQNGRRSASSFSRCGISVVPPAIVHQGEAVCSPPATGTGGAPCGAAALTPNISASVLQGQRPSLRAFASSAELMSSDKSI